MNDLETLVKEKFSKWKIPAIQKDIYIINEMMKKYEKVPEVAIEIVDQLDEFANGKMIGSTSYAHLENITKITRLEEAVQSK